MISFIFKGDRKPQRQATQKRQIAGSVCRFKSLDALRRIILLSSKREKNTKAKQLAIVSCPAPRCGSIVHLPRSKHNLACKNSSIQRLDDISSFVVVDAAW